MTNRTNRLNFWNLLFERLMASIAVLNFCAVLFDFSYIPGRDFYFRKVPQLTHVYDRVKGIESHREIEDYLVTIDSLKEQVSLTSINSKEVEEKLEEIRRYSNEIVDSNPFAAVGKSGTLEKIKNQMRQHTGQKSAKQAFATFWSRSNLVDKGWSQEIDFFQSKIRPLMASNYYRQIGENGDFIDKFWIIDVPFIIIFGFELLIRSFFIKRRHTSFNWFNVVLWRWYDVFLLLPFWQFLRIIPVIVRLEKSKLVNFKPLQQDLHQLVVANFAEELTEIVVVRVLNQIQLSIKKGELTRWLLQSQNLRPYIDINNVNEVEAIAGILVQAIVYKVLPKIQPEIIAILRHNIQQALNQSPIYRNLQFLPGVGQMQNQMSEQLATQIATNLYSAIVSAVEDPVSAKLSSDLMQRFTDALGSEVQKKQVIGELQSLLTDFLEEVKLNYVQRLSQEDVDQILEQTKKLRSQVSVQTGLEKDGSALVKRPENSRE